MSSSPITYILTASHVGNEIKVRFSSKDYKESTQILGFQILFGTYLIISVCGVSPSLAFTSQLRHKIDRHSL